MFKGEPMQASVVTAVQTVNIKNDFVSNTEPSEGFKLVFREKIESPSPENNNINNESTTISSNKQADTSNKQNVENKVESAKPEDIVRNTKEPLKPKLTENIATEASIDNKVNEQVVSKLLMDLLLSKLYNPKGEKLTLQKISELNSSLTKLANLFSSTQTLY